MGSKNNFSIFLLLILFTVHGTVAEEISIINPFKELQVLDSIPDDLLEKLILQVVEILRKGLLEAHVDALPIPDFDWTLEVNNLEGVFKFRDMIMFGLPDFVFQNISASVYERKLDFGLELPLIGVKGNYDVTAKLVGVPIWGGGAFSATFTKLQLSGGLQVNPAIGTLFEIKIANPYLSLGELNLTLEGLLAELNGTRLVLIIIAVFLMYTLIVLVVEFLIKKLIRKIRKPKVKEVD